MDFEGGIPITEKGHDYLFVVVENFIEMCIVMYCATTIKKQEATNLFLRKVQVHFGIPRSILSYKDTKFLNAFWTTL